MDVHSVRTFAEEVGRSEQFIRRAIELGKLDAKKVGNRWLIPGSEAQRFRYHPFKITRKEMVGQ